MKAGVRIDKHAYKGKQDPWKRKYKELYRVKEEKVEAVEVRDTSSFKMVAPTNHD
jgi:hypothetical protein